MNCVSILSDKADKKRADRICQRDPFGQAAFLNRRMVPNTGLTHIENNQISYI